MKIVAKVKINTKIIFYYRKQYEYITHPSSVSDTYANVAGNKNKNIHKVTYM
jgi:CRISPR/Cas system-associated endonuclease Cas3-HD